MLRAPNELGEADVAAAAQRVRRSLPLLCLRERVARARSDLARACRDPLTPPPNPRRTPPGAQIPIADCSSNMDNCTDVLT